MRNNECRSIRKALASGQVWMAVFLSSSCVAFPAALHNATLPVTEDAFVHSGFTTQKKNFGVDPVLEVQGGHSEAYLKFDLSKSESMLKQAKLRFYAGAEKPSLTTLIVNSVSADSWSETLINWKNKPQPGEEAGRIQMIGSSPTWYEVDVTSVVKKQLASADKTVSFVLSTAESEANKITINSREADANKPELVLSRSLLKIKVTFRPSETNAPTGYLVDNGGIFGPHPNGFTYGWSTNISRYVVERTAADKPLRPPDIRYAGVASMDNGEMQKPAFWGISVPNGSYQVHVVAGDPSNYDSVYAVNVNGVLVANGIPEQNKRWVEGSKTVSVTNEKIIVNNAPKSINNKLCFIEISEVAASPANRTQ